MTRAIPHVASYRRQLPVSLERLYENALDWEHLPYLHSSSFAWIKCLDAGDWGWRAEFASTGDESNKSIIELRLDRQARRWITSTLEGRSAGTEIWTHAFAEEPFRTDIVVDFFVPGVPPEKQDRVGKTYTDLYSTLYDEDVAMMVERQRQLDARRAPRETSDRVDLGIEADVRGILPFTFEFAGREYRLVDLDGELFAHTTVCPHLLGPLGDSPIADGVISCPWHDYKFDVRTGAALSDHTCKLPKAPNIGVKDGRVIARPR